LYGNSKLYSFNLQLYSEYSYGLPLATSKVKACLIKFLSEQEFNIWVTILTLSTIPIICDYTNYISIEKSKRNSAGCCTFETLQAHWLKFSVENTEMLCGNFDI